MRKRQPAVVVAFNCPLRFDNCKVATRELAERSVCVLLNEQTQALLQDFVKLLQIKSE